MANLTLACQSCNEKKNTQDIRDFLQDQPTKLAKILAQAKRPLKDAAQGIGHKHCRLMQRNDGYGYCFNQATGKDKTPISSLNLPSRSRAGVAAQHCG